MTLVGYSLQATGCKESDMNEATQQTCTWRVLRIIREKKEFDTDLHILIMCLQASYLSSEDSTHGHHQMVKTEIRLIIFYAAKDGEDLYSQQKQALELTVANIMRSLLPNSDSN